MSARNQPPWEDLHGGQWRVLRATLLFPEQLLVSRQRAAAASCPLLSLLSLLSWPGCAPSAPTRCADASQPRQVGRCARQGGRAAAEGCSPACSGLAASPRPPRLQALGTASTVKSGGPDGCGWCSRSQCPCGLSPLRDPDASPGLRLKSGPFRGIFPENSSWECP